MNASPLVLADAVLLVGLFAAVALAFLLLGWRLGRESVGRPMFEYAPPLSGDTAVEGDHDPWTEAMLGFAGQPPAASDSGGLVGDALPGGGTPPGRWGGADGALRDG